MQPWAVIAEWVKGNASYTTPRNASEQRTHRYRVSDIHSLSKGLPGMIVNVSSPVHSLLANSENAPDSLESAWFKILLDKSQRRLLRRLKRRERYRETLDRGLRMGHEINLEGDDGDDRHHWAVSYQSVPLRKREFFVNMPQEQTVRIAWSSEHKGDTALLAYNYNSFNGHTANWMVSGSGGPLSITSRGELTDGDFEQENDVKLRSNIRSHPIETDVNGAIRINYLTDNVDFRWKAAVKYPLLMKSLKISHGIERQELYGCCWTMKAEKTSEDFPWRAVRMETTGTVTRTGSISRLDHVRAQLIRHLIGDYNVEIEAKTPFTQRCLKWTSKLKHKNERGRECTTALEGEDSRVRAVSMKCSYKPVKDVDMSIGTKFQPDDGWTMSTSLKLGPQDSNDANQKWNVRGELSIGDGNGGRRANVDLFIPIRFPAAFSPHCH